MLSEFIETVNNYRVFIRDMDGGTETASAFPVRSVAGLASESKMDNIPYGRRFPAHSAAGSFK